MVAEKGIASKVQTLLEAQPGETYGVAETLGGWGVRRRLWELGIIPGARLKVIISGPFRGPVCAEVLSSGIRVSLGRGLAAKVLVRRLCDG